MSGQSYESVEVISGAISYWLKAEVVTSGESRNSYLDGADGDKEEAERKFENIRERLALPYDDNENWNANKDKSHQGRWPGWLQAYELDPENELACAQVGFAPLMSTSGAYRIQCYLEANGQDDYLQRRNNAIGIDIEAAVDSRLKEILTRGEFSSAEMSFGGLARTFDYTYAQGEIGIRAMSARLGRGYYLGVENSRSVNSMRNNQYNQVRLATDCIAMAAKIRRGELAAVPFLEPVSISDQSGKIHYPLASPVNWADALTG